MKNWIFAVVMVFFSSMAFAQSSIPGMSYVSGISLRPSWNAGVGPAVHFTAASINNQCPTADTGNQPTPTFHIKQSNPLFKEMYAMLLTADTTKRKVSMYVGSCFSYSQEVLWITLRQPGE